MTPLPPSVPVRDLRLLTLSDNLDRVREGACGRSSRWDDSINKPSSSVASLSSAACAPLMAFMRLALNPRMESCVTDVLRAVADVKRCLPPLLARLEALDCTDMSSSMDRLATLPNWKDCWEAEASTGNWESWFRLVLLLAGNRWLLLRFRSTRLRRVEEARDRTEASLLASSGPSSSVSPAPPPYGLLLGLSKTWFKRMEVSRFKPRDGSRAAGAMVGGGGWNTKSNQMLVYCIVDRGSRVSIAPLVCEYQCMAD